MTANRKYPGGLGRRRVIRLPDAMDERLVTLAREHGCSVSDLIRLAVSDRFILPALGTNPVP